MELYRKYPIVCTIWAFLEVVCFGGVIFGWGSLVFILKEEGFYRDFCQDELEHYKTAHGLSNTQVIVETNITTDLDKQGVRDGQYVGDVHTDELTSYTNVDNATSLQYIEITCASQESRLNLWFSIAVSFMYLSFTGIGYLKRSIGTRLTRIIFIIVYLIGTLCLAFATPEIPWLILPGLCCIGTGGLVILATNLQVANLHPHIRSTIVAIFTGLFDFSTITKQLIKVAYENGIMRRSCYIFVSCFFTVVVLSSTLIMLPHKTISEELVADIKKRRASIKTTKQENEMNGHLNTNKEEPTEVLYEFEEEKKEPPSLCETLMSFTFVLHLYWLFVHALRFVTFIGLLNRWLEDLTNKDEQKVGHLLSVFAYMTMGAIGTALLCGFIYDWQRNKYADSGPIRSVYSPVVFPMVLVIAYSIGTTVLCFFRSLITPYFAFAIFTFLRSSLFTVGVAFVGDAYPMDYFGVMFGFIQFAAGLAGLIQYPLFEWYDAYEGSYVHVNILLLALQISTLIHPAILFIKGRRDHSVSKENDVTMVIE